MADVHRLRVSEVIDETPDAKSFVLEGGAFTWRAGRNYVRLGPGKSHLLKVQT